MGRGGSGLLGSRRQLAWRCGRAGLVRHADPPAPCDVIVAADSNIRRSTEVEGARLWRAGWGRYLLCVGRQVAWHVRAERSWPGTFSRWRPRGRILTLDIRLATLPTPAPCARRTAGCCHSWRAAAPRVLVSRPRWRAAAVSPPSLCAAPAARPTHPIPVRGSARLAGGTAGRHEARRQRGRWAGSPSFGVDPGTGFWRPRPGKLWMPQFGGRES